MLIDEFLYIFKSIAKAEILIKEILSLTRFQIELLQYKHKLFITLNLAIDSFMD